METPNLTSKQKNAKMLTNHGIYIWFWEKKLFNSIEPLEKNFSIGIFQKVANIAGPVGAGL